MSNAMDTTLLTRRIQELEAQAIELKAEVFALGRAKILAEQGLFQMQNAAIDPNCKCDEHGACSYCWEGKKQK